MAHIKRFEEFKNEQHSINELFKSKEKAAEKEAAKNAFEDKLKELQGKKYVVDVEHLTKQAEDNKFRGELKPVRSKRSGKVMVIYKDGLTNLQKFASGAGSAMSTEGEEFEEEDEDENVTETEEYNEEDFDDVDESAESAEDEEEDEFDLTESNDDCEDDCDEEEDEFDLTEYDNVKEFFGNDKDLEKNKTRVEKEIDAALSKDGIKGDKTKLMAKAKKNKFRGRISTLAGNVSYREGKSNMQKLASGSGGGIY